MPSPPRHLRIFLSSPTDVMPEREIAERAVMRLDGIWQAHIRLSVVRWERGFYEAVKSFQEAIGDMAAYDLVIGILWKRIGSKLMRRTYLSLGVEFPLRWRFYFYHANDRWRLIDLRVDDRLAGMFDEPKDASDDKGEKP